MLLFYLYNAFITAMLWNALPVVQITDSTQENGLLHIRKLQVSITHGKNINAGTIVAVRGLMEADKSGCKIPAAAHNNFICVLIVIQI